MIYFYFSNITYFKQYKGMFDNLPPNIGIIIGESIESDLLEFKNSDNIHFIRVNSKVLFWESVLNYARIKKQPTLSHSFLERFNVFVKDSNSLYNDIKKLFWGEGNLRLRVYLIRKYIIKNKFSLLVNLAAINTLIHDFLFELKIKDKLFFRQLNNLDISKIIFCYQGPHAETHLLLKYGKVKKIDILFFQHNWDNISSKELLFLLPKKLFVWSYQTSLHATSILKMHEKDVVIAGSYRLDSHIKYRNLIYHNIESDVKNEKRIIFWGDSSDMDEYRILKIISEILFSWEGKWICEYRPHPYLFKQKFGETEIPANIVVDIQIQSDYFSQNKSSAADINDRLISLNSQSFVNKVMSSSFVIVGGSTISLETLALGKPVILINSNLRGTKILDKTHFWGINNIEGVVTIEEEELDKFKLEVAMKLVISAKLNINQVKYYYDNIYEPKFEKIIYNFLT